MNPSPDGSPESARNGVATAARHDMLGVEVSLPMVTIPVTAVLPGDSPRLAGEDQAHISRLAEAQTALPPILVDRRTMRVIDGMHRLRAAVAKGDETVDVEYFDGSAADAFLRAVEANVTHGLPLSRGDRRAAAARIIALHPQMSDRAIAESAGLSAKTVAAIRQRSSGALPQSNARLGRDGRIRPLDRMAGRRRAADLLARYPDASLREVARRAGVAPSTVQDVRRHLTRGNTVGSARGGTHDRGGPEASCTASDAVTGEAAAELASAAVLGKLMRDPSVRHNEQGRHLLRWLRLKAVSAQDWHAALAAVPPHCTALVAELARQHAQEWLEFAQKLCERVQDAGTTLE